MNQATLIKKFADGRERGSASHMFIEGDILFSYGHHFPLLVRMPWGFLQNADKYSVTTSYHQAACRHHATVLIPFSALRSAGYSFYEKRWGNPELLLIDKAEAVYEDHTYTNKDGETVTIHERRPESCVISFSGKYFLCSMDNGRYFISELPAPAETVDAAFALLKPDLVQGVEGNDYLRQGEYFFVPVAQTLFASLKRTKARKGSHRQEHTRLDGVKKYTTVEVDYPLPAKNEDPHHYTTEIADAPGCPYPLVRGTVRHSRGDHRMLKLGNRKDWYIAVESNHVRSWGANGQVD